MRRDSEGERKRSKLSTEIGRTAWQQAGRKRKGKEAVRLRGSTVGTADRGEREEGKRKNGRLSSQNRAGADERKRSEGKARKRSGREETERKGSTGGTAVGAKPGRMKGNEQTSRVQRTGREDMRNQVGRNGESQGNESGEGAPDKPL